MSVAMVGAAAAVGGAYISAQGAKSAANTQAAAADRATASQQAMFDKTVQNNAPYNQAGQNATGRLQDLLGIGGGHQESNFDANAYLAANPDVAKDPYFATHPWEHYQKYGQNENRQFTQLAGTGSEAADFGSLAKPFSMADFHLDPGIQFQTQQGNLALTNSAAAKNGVLSGGALKDFIGYNQGMAGTAYQSAYERYMNNNASTYQKLMGMTGVGQAAASNSSSNAAAASGAMSNTITGSANAAASGIVGSANAMAGGISGAGNSYFLSSLLNKNGTSTSKAPGVVADDLSTADRTIG